MNHQKDRKLNLVEVAILNAWRWETGTKESKKRKQLSFAKFGKKMSPAVSASTVKRWLDQKFAVEDANHRAQLLGFINTINEEDKKAAAYQAMIRYFDLDRRRLSLDDDPYIRIKAEITSRWSVPPEPKTVPLTYEQLENKVISLSREVNELKSALETCTAQLEQADAAWLAAYQRMSAAGKLNLKGPNR